jgi:hypothetical protein
MSRRCGLMSIRSAAMVVGALAMATIAAAQQSSGGRDQNRQNQSNQPQSQTNQQNQQQKPAAAANQGTTADISDVTRHPDKYLKKPVTVEGEVTDVLGPHLFVIDAKKLLHLWGGMVVIVPEPFAAVIRRDGPVRVTGTVEKVVLAEAKRKWAFLSDPGVEVDLFEKPVIVASEVTTVAPALLTLKVGPGQPVGTSGSGSSAPIADAKQIAGATDTSLVGRRVEISGTVSRTADNGFWLRTPSGAEVFVTPATRTSVRQGQAADVRGTLLESPRRTTEQSGSGKNPPIYIYADQIAPK